MSQKSSPGPIIVDHLGTFRDAGTGKRSFWDFLLQLGLPIAVAVLSAFAGYRATDIGAFLGGVAVFAALLFALVVFVFQLRITAGNDPVASGRKILLKLLDELFANVSYAVLIGLLTTCLGIIAIWVGHEKEGAPVWVSCLLVGTVTHLVLTILMCLKRINSAYRMMPK
jgi:uncharacterized membrane protein YhaH (DUF805 family)